MNYKVDFVGVMERLKQALDIRSDRSLAERLGTSSNAYANLKKRGALPFDKVIILAMKHDLSIDDLLCNNAAISANKSQMEDSSVNLLDGLTEAQKNAVLNDIEDKRRLNLLEEQIVQIKK